ncbi:MAG: spore gernimation protein [Bacilli bacterium]|nr:spore gernimation protein [Bacilli bacterium]
MKIILLRMAPAILLFSLLISCGSDKQPSSQGQGQGYKDTKTMVLDVLKSSEGQSALQEATKNSQDQTTKLLSTGEGQQIQIAVKDILTNTTGIKMLEKTMTDPKFAGQFAKAIQKNNQQIHKDLMKDPDYQKSMLEVMNNPEFEKLLTTTMKNTVYRQQMMSVIQESMKSPIFKMQLMELLKKVVEEGTTPKVETLDKKPEGGKQDKKDSGQSGGDSSDSGGGSTSGSDQSDGGQGKPKESPDQKKDSGGKSKDSKKDSEDQ